MKTIHQEIKINMGTLEAYGQYVDYIVIPDLDLQIRLTVKKNDYVNNSIGNQLKSENPNLTNT